MVTPSCRHAGTGRPCHFWNERDQCGDDGLGCTDMLSGTLSAPLTPDMDRVSAEELMMVSAAEREQAYDELHGVFTKSLAGDDDGLSSINTTLGFEETNDLVESSLLLLKMELLRIPTRRKRAYLKALFLKPTLENDNSFQLMFLRADRFNVPLAAQRLCLFFDQKLQLFGEAKLVHRLTLDDLSEDDIRSLCNGAGHLMPHTDRSGRLVFFADYFFLDFKDYTNVNRMAWSLVMAAVEGNDDVQKNGVVEVFFANDALGKRTGIIEHLTKGLSALLCLPIRFAGIHICYDNAVFKPVVQLMQMAFGAGNRLRFRSHFGSAMEIQYELLSYGIVIPMELLNRDTLFKRALDEAYLSKRQVTDAQATAEHALAKESDMVHLLVDHPESEDVLLGKGRYCQEYPGNQAMNRMIDKRASNYCAGNKDEKSRIASSIVEHIQLHGRFLERIDGAGWKLVLDQTTLRNKITQAFRVRNRVSVTDHIAIKETDEIQSIKRFRNSSPS